MLREDLEKRLEDIEAKIEELEDCILDNRLKIIELVKKMEKRPGPELVKFEESTEETAPEPRRPTFQKKDYTPAETDDFKTRARKIKEMLRELE